MRHPVLFAIALAGCSDAPSPASVPAPAPAPAADAKREGPAVVRREPVATPPPAQAPATPPATKPTREHGLFSRPPDAVTPKDPAAIAIRLYREASEPLDPFAAAPPAPAGVQIATRTDPEAAGRRVASIDRVEGETFAQTVARVRPWFEALEIGANRRWLFGIVRPDADNRGIDVVLVVDDPVIVRGGDIAWVHHDAGMAAGVEIMWSDAAKQRLAQQTAHLVDHAVAISVADRLLWAPKLGSAFGSHDTPSRLLFVEDAALGKAIRDAVAGDAAAIDALTHDRVVPR